MSSLAGTAILIAMANVKPIPEGFTSVSVHMVVSDAAGFMDFCKRAFGATERMRMPAPGGKVMHGEVSIGDGTIMVGDEMPQMGKSAKTLGGSPVTISLYVPDVDATFAKAIAAGAEAKMPVADMFWGDRYGQIVDPYGNTWALATHKEDVSPEEMSRRAQKMFSAGH